MPALAGGDAGRMRRGGNTPGLHACAGDLAVTDAACAGGRSEHACTAPKRLKRRPSGDSAPTTPSAPNRSSSVSRPRVPPGRTQHTQHVRRAQHELCAPLYPHSMQQWGADPVLKVGEVPRLRLDEVARSETPFWSGSLRCGVNGSVPAGEAVAHCMHALVSFFCGVLRESAVREILQSVRSVLSPIMKFYAPEQERKMGPRPGVDDSSEAAKALRRGSAAASSSVVALLCTAADKLSCPALLHAMVRVCMHVNARHIHSEVSGLLCTWPPSLEHESPPTPPPPGPAPKPTLAKMTHA